MSGVSPIIILLLATTATVSTTTDDLGAYFKLLTDLKSHPSAGAGAQLMWDVVRDTGRYLCAIGDKQCDAVMLVLLEDNLEKRNINCDEKRKNKLCVQARQLLGSDSLPHREMKNRLIAKADKIFKETHDNFLILDNIRVSLIDFICAVDKKEVCEFWRLVSTLKQNIISSLI